VPGRQAKVNIKPSYDVIIIGAGIVGCAMARRFTLEGAQVLVVEKNEDILGGASKGNSGYPENYKAGLRRPGNLSTL